MTDRSVRPGWWTLDKAERATEALGVARGLSQHFGGDQRKRELVRERQYEGQQPDSADKNEARSEYNVIQSTVDAFTSQLVRQRIRLQFLTQAGNWEERQKAQAMGRACEAQFEEAGLYGEEGIQLARAGLVHGTAAVKMVVDYENERILLERFSAAELLVDPRDARYGKPRQLVHEQLIPREVLIARFPDEKSKLEEVDAAPIDHEGGEAVYTEKLTVSEQIRVFEIWHLPSGRVDLTKNAVWGQPDKEGEEPEPPGHDGRHMLLVEGHEDTPIVLHDEPWPLDRFPIAVFRPKPKLRGFFGSGFVDRLKRVQSRINKMLLRVDNIMDLHARFMLAVDKHRVDDSILSNDYTRIVKVDGNPTTAIAHFAPNVVGPEYLQQIDKLIQWAHDVVGLSELSLMARKPPGIESGTALNTMLDTESVRHSDLFRQYEAFHVELGKIQIEGFRLLARKSKDFKVIWAGDKGLEAIKWSEVDLENERWRLRVWPINLFPQTPTAKMDKLVKLYQAEGINKDQLAMALASEYPDVEALMGDKSAPLNNIEKKLEAVIKSKRCDGDNAPHPFMDLPLAKIIALGRLNALEADGAPSDVQLAVRGWIDLVMDEITKTAPPPPPGGPGAPPGGELPRSPPPTPLTGAPRLPAAEQGLI